MHQGPSVIVKKGGFFTALVSGVCTLATVSVICATAAGFYGFHLVDRRADQVFGWLGTALENPEQWRESLPAAVADALSDRRAPEYAGKLEKKARLAGAARDGHPQRVVIEVRNTGDEIISLAALNVVLEDAQGVPLRDFVAYAATPIAVEDQWRGPLLPGASRKIVQWVRADGDVSAVQVELADVRVATPRAERAAKRDDDAASRDQDVARRD